MSEASDTFFPAFLDDYFAECEEHLTAIQHHLLAMEAFIEQGSVDRAVLDSLFRSFHTIKGLSGMVDLKPAEVLAHDMESYLRGLRSGEIALTSAGLDALIGGTKRLEQVVVAHQTHAPMPEIASVGAQLQALLAAPAIAPALPDSSSKPTLTELPAPALKQWCFQFTPVPELVRQGVNVNWLRAQLEAIGKIVHAEPLISANGGVTFQFVVETQADEATFADWCADHVTYQRYEPPPEAVKPTPQPELSEVLAIEKSAPNPAIALATSSEAPPESPTGAAIASGSVVRVEIAKLDELMRLVGELVLNRTRLDTQLAQLTPMVPALQLRALQEINLSLGRQIRDLRTGIMRVRLVPIGEIFVRMQFVVRDLARESGKQVTLQFSGQDTEIDKLVVERMLDPLMHLVRNAISHGLEAPTERLARGKPAIATLSLRAATQSEMVVIEVADDGRGIDAQQVAAQARAAGVWRSDQPLDAEQLLEILCMSGFSTQKEADLTSGRGVGMAVVQEVVQQLGGVLTLTTQLGVGTCFKMELPLTLAIADALIVTVQDQPWAVPLMTVREVLELPQTAIVRVGDREMMPHRGSVLPLFDLGQLLGMAHHDRPSWKVLVVNNGANLAGIRVDRILGQQEIVVRSLTDPLVQIAGIMGATDLGNGQAVLILEMAKLIRATQLKSPRAGGDSGGTRHD